MEYEKMNLEIEEGVAILTLNNPDKLNALSTKMWEDIRLALDEVHGNDEVNVFVITGTGRAFCSGSDVGGRLAVKMEGGGSKPTQAELLEGTGYVAHWFRKLDVPIIAAINGVAAGAGLSMTLLSDIRIASEVARFSAVWVRVGLIGDLGATWLLPRAVGASKAIEMLCTGDMYSAQEALEMGLVSKVVPPDELMPTVNEMAVKIAKGPSVAIKFAKRAVYRSFHNDFVGQLDFESFGQGVCRGTEDHREGVRAFMEKKEAKFKGF
ncbi:enoyl-CoA hydratase/isomerase family protein [Thermodesulfobacteriota bacterium]